MQSRRCRRRPPRDLPPCRRHARLLRPAVHPGPRAGRTGPAQRAACGRDHRRRGARRRLHHLEPRSDLRRRHRERRRLGGHARPRPRVATTRRRTSAPTASPSSPAPRWPPTRRAIPTTTSRRGATSAPRPSSPPPATTGRRSPTGPGPVTSAGTTTSTGSRATTSASARPPTRTAPARAGGTCGRRTATSTPSTPGARPRADARSSRAEQREFEALSLSLRTPRGVPWESLERPEELEGLVEQIDGRAVLTLRGRLLANEVSARIRSGILHR